MHIRNQALTLALALAVFLLLPATASNAQFTTNPPLPNPNSCANTLAPPCPVSPS